MNALAVILARGGSRGVPRKNIAPVAGRPCIAWTVDAARAARAVSHIVISTDDPEIAGIARTLSVDTIPRPAHLASDTATIDDAARHAAAEFLQTHGANPSADTPIVLLYANIPVRPPGLIDRALGLLNETGCDSVQSYAPVGKHHPWWTARLDDSGRIRPWDGDVLNHNTYRRQDLPPAFIPDGGVLALTCRALFLEIPGIPPGPHAFFGRDRRGITTQPGEVIDIDSPIDLLVADAILRTQPQPRHTPASPSATRETARTPTSAQGH